MVQPVNVSRGVRFSGTHAVVGSPSDSTNDANQGQSRTSSPGTPTLRGDYTDGIHSVLRMPESAIDLIEGPPAFSETLPPEVLNANATASHVSNFIVTSMSLPVGIDITCPTGSEIRVRDVLRGVVSHLQQPVPDTWLQDLRNTDESRYLEVYLRCNTRVRLGKLEDPSVRWVDYLPDNEHTFMGLSSERAREGGITSRVLKIPGGVA
ncbi:hypothetical protein DXG01_010341 [Tephrocybe rancida]|nr:hypothetical protein DXG01_010341 [Tephrocybe rancida]